MIHIGSQPETALVIAAPPQLGQLLQDSNIVQVDETLIFTRCIETFVPPLFMVSVAGTLKGNRKICVPSHSVHVPRHFNPVFIMADLRCSASLHDLMTNIK